MEQRSPFGELVRQYRRQLGLSQQMLALQINALANEGKVPIEGRVSAKTIYNHEAKCASPADFAVPRIGTIAVYADAFGLAPGSRQRQQLIDAAEETRRRKSDASEIAGDMPSFSPEFVLAGREELWDRLCRALGAALRGEPQMILLQGEAGIGKTRLLTELARHAETADPRLVVAWGQSLESNRLPYHALRDAFALLFGQTENAGATELVSATTAPRLRARAPQALEALVMPGPAPIAPLVDSGTVRSVLAALPVEARAIWRERVEPVLQHAPGIDSETLPMQVGTVLRRYAASGPLLLVLDDLHWATPALLGLVTRLAPVLRRAGNTPILLLGAFRPQVLARSPEDEPHPLSPVLAEIGRLWDDPVVDLADSIRANAGRAYIDGRLDLVPNHLDRAFREALFAKTGGLPLFVENALHTLQHHGQLQPGADGALVLTGSPDDLDLPSTTRAIVGERFRDLDRLARQALAIASVQGEQFFAEPVAAVLGLAPEAAAQLFDMTLATQAPMLMPAGTVTIAGHRLHRYQFVHAIYRDVLFDQLGVLRREQHQAATAGALAGLVGAQQSELSAIIAQLYEQTGERAAAATHHKLAGTYDLDTQDPESAAAHFERVIALAERPAQQELVGEAMLGIGHSLRKLGHYRDAVRQCRCALKFGRAVGSASVEAFALVSLGLLANDLGELTESETNFAAALPILGQLGDRREECRAEGLLAHVLYRLGRYDDAIEHADRALVLASQMGDESLAAESRLAAANCLLDLGCYEEAISTFAEAIERYRHVSNRRGEAICWADIALCQVGLSAWDDALASLRQADVIGDRLSTIRLVPHIELYRGLVYEARADWRAAKRAYTTALRLRRRYGQAGYAIDALAGLLRVNIAMGRPWFARRLVWGIGRWLEAHGAEGIEEPFRVALSCVDALEALDEPAAAARLLAASTALLQERAARIATPAHRTSYLHRVPANRALLARAAARDKEWRRAQWNVLRAG